MKKLPNSTVKIITSSWTFICNVGGKRQRTMLFRHILPVLTGGYCIPCLPARIASAHLIAAFVIPDRRVRFDVNQKAESKFGIALIAKLLKVAKSVEK